MACRKELPAAAELLIAKGADVNANDIVSRMGGAGMIERCWEVTGQPSQPKRQTAKKPERLRSVVGGLWLALNDQGFWSGFLGNFPWLRLVGLQL